MRVVETLITATPEFFKGMKKNEIRAYFQTALEFIEKYQDSKTILSAVVHMDEKTPHMHLAFVPIIQDGRLCAKEITDLLENTNFFNAGKNTDKAVELLQKFFPAMENFQTQIRKYDQTIRSLKSDKSSLQEQTKDLIRQVKEAKSSSVQKKMDDARLRADYENLQRLVNRIPPKILELAKRGQLSHSNREL